MSWYAGENQITVWWDTGPDWPPAVRHTLHQATANTSSCCYCCLRSPPNKNHGYWWRADSITPVRSPRLAPEGSWIWWGSWPTPAATFAIAARGAASRPCRPRTLSPGTPPRRRRTAAGRRHRPSPGGCRSNIIKTRFASPCRAAVRPGSWGMTWETLKQTKTFEYVNVQFSAVMIILYLPLD